MCDHLGQEPNRQRRVQIPIRILDAYKRRILLQAPTNKRRALAYESPERLAKILYSSIQFIGQRAQRRALRLRKELFLIDFLNWRSAAAPNATHYDFLANSTP